MCIFSAFTDECIFKYDHYCPWTNNALGGLNHRYFLAFLISLRPCVINSMFRVTYFFQTKAGGRQTQHKRLS